MALRNKYGGIVGIPMECLQALCMTSIYRASSVRMVYSAPEIETRGSDGASGAHLDHGCAAQRAPHENLLGQIGSVPTSQRRENWLNTEPDYYRVYGFSLAPMSIIISSSIALSCRLHVQTVRHVSPAPACSLPRAPV